jgi:hypothetical protein
MSKIGKSKDFSENNCQNGVLHDYALDHRNNNFHFVIVKFIYIFENDFKFFSIANIWQCLAMKK